ncbi:hypothetical protein [Tsuneonella mangrovi]|uniref:hypothetical protein n=1 Tax=Tsuneonella mangrovi TaxID=1982042 RepID=UPI000BA26E89|nr:hypothetical protein [Tsuneonella mangrovi]
MSQEDDDKARARFFAINAIRVSGVALVVIGLLVNEGVIDLPKMVAYVFIPLGLFDTFVMPQVLARRWRTPPE